MLLLNEYFYFVCDDGFADDYVLECWVGSSGDWSVKGELVVELGSCVGEVVGVVGS